MYFSKEGQEKIQRQIEIIELVGTEILKSKESARQFLIDAGIIKEKRKRKPSSQKR